MMVETSSALSKTNASNKCGMEQSLKPTSVAELVLRQPGVAKASRAVRPTAFLSYVPRVPFFTHTYISVCMYTYTYTPMCVILDVLRMLCCCRWGAQRVLSSRVFPSCILPS